MSLFTNESYNGQKIQNVDHITVNLVAASTAQTIFVAPTDYKVVAAHVSFGTASTSGTVNVEILPQGTAKGSGALVFGTGLALSGTANTTVTLAAPSNKILVAGQRLAIVLGGTLTGLVDGYLQLELAKV